MIHVKHKLGLAVLCTGSLLPSLQAADAAGLEFFEKKIRPVLVEHCYKCHSAESLEANKLKGGLRLDTQGGTRAGGDTGPAVVPGKVSESLLISALRQERFEMPPKGKLPDAVIADFVKWIEMGAPDPRTKEVAAHPKPAITAGDHWAFKPAVAAKLPNVKRTAWLKGDLDRFVLARMEEKELQPVSAASDRELAEEAWAGDIIGIPNHGQLRIGDTLTEGEALRVSGIPSFAPELLQACRAGDPMKAKHLEKALMQFAEEGAAKVFKPGLGSGFIVGVVGALQFEVLASRIELEYGLPVRFETSQFTSARWVSGTKEAVDIFSNANRQHMAFDHDGDHVYLTRLQWDIDRVQRDYPDVTLTSTKEMMV